MWHSAAYVNFLSFSDTAFSMYATYRRSRATIPGTYANLLMDTVARWNITPAQMLEGTGIAPSQLLDPVWHLDFEVFENLVRRAIVLTGEPGLGFHVGVQMTVTCHGLIGFAAMIAKDIREALEIAQEFVRLQTALVSLRLEVGDEHAYLYFEQHFSKDLEDAVTFCLMLGFAMMGSAVCGRQLVGDAEIPFAEPEYFHRFAHLVPGKVSFNQPHMRLAFPLDFLDIPMIMADPSTARLAREQCKRSLNALVGHDKISEMVRELVYDEALGFSSMEDVADKLHMSERTLQRQLTQEGTSFRTVVDELRLQKAGGLLKRKELSLEAIAEMLGYTDVTNFTRAFKRWTGQTPSKFRA
jgi:AraC-like DNA-binding protein